jgi:tRNA pseudouridine55 synthase
VSESVNDRVFNLKKSPGRTTYDVIRLFKRAHRVKKIGHAGSLDRQATGVVLVCTGRTTKITGFLMDLTKTYEAEVSLGRSTDTHDREGRTLEEAPVPDLDRETVLRVLQSFRGEQMQTPPMVSAIKHQGRPLYLLARRGIEVERRPRKIRIFALDLLSFDLPLLSLRVRCSRGTYLRTIAHDLGARLGVPAHLSALCRTAVGPFEAGNAVEDAVLLSERPDVGPGYTLSQALSHLGELRLTEEAARSVLQGRQPDCSFYESVPDSYVRGEHLRMTDGTGEVLAVARASVSSADAAPMVLPGHPFQLVRVFGRIGAD